MSKAVIYARYSSHNQREESIEQQVAECRAFAETGGYEVAGVYADEAVSGRTEKRSAFQRLMRDADHHKFDAVIAYKSNRIARNMLTALQYEARLDDLGIQTLYAKEEFGNTASGRFALRMMMNVNQFYSENMAEDIRRGMRDNAENCKVNGAIPFGYRKGQDGKYEIHPDQAPVAKEIFERVALGEPYKSIRDDLNRRGIKTRFGKPWGPSSFTKILSNPSYIGVYHNSGVSVPGGMPAIISEELFEKVQKRKDGMLPQETPSDYLLTGKLFCGDCESPMVGICGTSRTGARHYYYSCNGHRHGGCRKKNEKKEWLERTVVKLTIENILTDAFIAHIADVSVQLQEDAKRLSPLATLRTELKDVEARRKNMAHAIEIGIVTKTTLTRLRELEAEVADLEERIEKFEAIKPVDRDKLIFTLEKLRDGDVDDPRFRKLLVRSFVKAVWVFDDQLKIDYKLPTGSSGDFQAPPYESVRTTGSFLIIYCIDSAGLSAVFKVPPVRV